MTKATLTFDTKFNPARAAAFSAIAGTLAAAEWKPTTEVEFRDILQKNLSDKETIINDGWYSPPPFGCAVLFGKERISFKSLRSESFWPSNENKIDFEDGLMYAYCSPVHKETGTIGDISVCLYFGADERIRAHFINAHRATAALIGRLPEVSNSFELWDLSRRVFKEHNLANNIDSVSDPLNNNIGHTFPSLGKIHTDALSAEQKSELSRARKFINGGVPPFEFIDGMQFTIEPQLYSTTDPALPKATLHYLAQKIPGGYRVCNIVDRLSAKYRLT
ncbi:MAG: hypothetical protein LBG89_01455 [Rickettsiales bacterium]|nr:hypothetical protein [Rickettsiales bacterium]